ncbi:Sickle tail protein -like protein [Triplophysa tibetana]|uniref:Sickle tail protein-like protein n=1 Tax=Triplophysa tibetana TaxID=1572043 RepID=A0A5A9PBU4_9TELE|nr:Sickle tail protein -like protein [Triplophysa tibetana]
MGRADSRDRTSATESPQDHRTWDLRDTTHPHRQQRKPAKSNQRLISHEEAEEHVRQQSSADEIDRSDPWSPRTVPRRHTVGGPRTAGDVIVMQSYSIDHKKEAFLEHLKQKYPNHASIIMGHQERHREQVRSSVRSVTPQCAIGESGEHLSLACLDSSEAMSEGDAPSAFTRGSRTRASLPVVKSTNQTRDRSLGVLYLQYGEETKQIRMPNEVTSADTIKALFVSAFPQHLSMKILESPSVAIYIKDDMRNMYYELNDARNITPQSCLKVYHKDPAQAFNHNPRANNGDIRITRERLYSNRQQHGPHSPVHTLSGPQSPLHQVQGSMSPPTPRSVPSSPSRISYSHSTSVSGSATLPRERLSSVPTSRSNTPCPSAILERRDVKPDEDLSKKSVPVFADPYAQLEARLSLASSQGSHTGDIPDGAANIQHRSSVKSTSAYPDGQDQHTLYRQKSRKYSESQLGSKTPPASPHRVNEVRMIDTHPGQNSHMQTQGVAMERASTVRRSLRKDGNGNMELTRVRGNMTSPVFADFPPAHGERSFQGVSAGDPQSVRIKAMEQQIASLTGLVQHALFKGPNTSAKETTRLSRPSQILLYPSLLFTFKRNVSDLRLQLYQLKQLQLQNQETMKMMLRQAEQEITGKLSDTPLRPEDPVQRQRVLVEDERHKYLCMEENVLLQLGELENYVEKLKRESTCGTSHQAVTLKDVEEGAVNLRKVGEALAALKGEFPELQMKMRAVLRVEVEAVRFLKEEPHKMDSTLKRVKALTETLSGLRRYATDSQNHASETVKTVTDYSVVYAEGCRSPKPVQDSPTPQPRSPAKVSSSESTPSSHYTVHRVRTTPISTHHASPPLTPSHSRDSPTVAMVIPRSRENSPDLKKRAAPQDQEAQLSATAVRTGPLTCSQLMEETTFNINTSMSEEVSERAVEGKHTNSALHSSGIEMEKEMERILQQTQASLLNSIPDLELSDQADKTSSQPSSSRDEMEFSLPMSPLPEARPQDGPKADKPVQTSLERPQKATIEKPHRASVDRGTPNPETASKSPPPPPPRRFYPSGTKLTTGRSGEVIYTTRKESTSAQEAEEEAPQPKPLRVPPEVKPKPCSPPPVNTSTLQDEGDKIMAELRVIFYFNGTTTKTSSESGEANLQVPTEGIFPSSKVASENAFDLYHQPNLLTSDEVSKISFKSETQSKLSDAQQVSSGPINSFAVAVKERSLINPIEMKTESVLKSLKQEVPTTSEKIKPVETSEQQIAYTSNEQDTSVHPRTTTVEVTLVSKSSHNAEPQVYPPVSQSSSATWSLQQNDIEQQIITRSSNSQVRYTEDASLSPDLPGEEAPPPPNNIAFRITNSKVQALSTGEYQQLVNSRGEDVQTLKVGSEQTLYDPEDCGFDKRPVIIIFDEPMDIHQAYKRLSTVFECEEELERVLSEERIDEETEEEVEMTSRSHVEQMMLRNNIVDKVNNQRSSSVGNALPLQRQSSCESSSPDVEDGDKTGSPKDAKKKFKFKFPKKQLAAIGQALRARNKAGKKTLQVVVYEDEEEPDGTVSEHKEAKRFEVKSQADPDSTTPRTVSQSSSATSQTARDRTEEIRKTTYKTLDSLEQTIKQLENTISDIGPGLSTEVSHRDSKLERIPSHAETEDGSPTKKPPPLKPKPHKSSQHKRSKAQSRSSTSTSSSSSSSSSSSKQNTGDSLASSRISSPKSRPHPGIAEKPEKPQKLQDPQRQFRQANGSAMKGDEHASLALPVSKIPACARGTRTRSLNSNVLRATKQTSSSKSFIPSLSLSWPSCGPELTSDDSIQSPRRSRRSKDQNLALCPHAQNVKYCSYCYSSSSSSSSSVSPTLSPSCLLSPTAVSRGSRTAHTDGSSTPASSSGDIA